MHTKMFTSLNYKNIIEFYVVWLVCILSEDVYLMCRDGQIHFYLKVFNKKNILGFLKQNTIHKILLFQEKVIFVFRPQCFKKT